MHILVELPCYSLLVKCQVLSCMVKIIPVLFYGFDIGK